MTAWRLAWLDICRRPIASVIVVVAVALAVACSGLLLRLYTLSNSRFATIASAGEAVVGAKAAGLDLLLGSLNLEGRYPGFLPAKLYDSLRARAPVRFEDGTTAQPNYIESITALLYCGLVEGKFRVIGTDQGFFERPRGESLRLKAGTFGLDPGQIVAGARVAEQLGLKLGSSVLVRTWFDGEPTQELSGGAESFRVSGILAATDTAWDLGLYVSLAESQRLIGQENLSTKSIWGSEVVNYFLIYLGPSGFAELENLINKRTVGQVIRVPEELSRLADITGSGRQLGLLISSFIMLLGGLAVAGTMITRFDAMSSQIAVLRAIGYDGNFIYRWLLLEGLLLGLGACVIGLGLDWLFFPVVRTLLGSGVPSDDFHRVGLLASSPVWIIALICTLAAVMIPLLRLSRQSIHDALRS